MKYRRLAGVATSLLCVLFGLPAFSGVNTWTGYSPAGGTFHDIAESYDTSGLFAAFGTGLYLSYSDVGHPVGGSWSLLYEFEEAVTDIEVDPAFPARVYVIVENKGLFRSDDRAHTFTALVPATPAQLIAVGAANDGHTIYYSTASGRFISSPDKGVTLIERSTTGVLGASQIVVDKADSALVYAVRGAHVLRSPDGGVNWTSAQVDPAVVNPASVFEVVKLPGTNLVAAADNGVYTSGDGGVSWTLRQAGRFLSVRPSRSASNNLVVADRNTGLVYRSSDSGVTWTPLPKPVYGLPRKAIYHTTYASFVASEQGVQYWTGTDWSFAETGPTASTPFSMSAAGHAFTVNDGSGLFAPNGDRIDLTPAHAFVGNLSFDRASLAVRPDDPQRLYLGVYDKGVLRSTDGGTSWVGLGTGLTNFGVDTIGFDPEDPDTMFASVSRSISNPPQGLYGSIDAGVTWTARSTNLPPVAGTSIAIDPSNSNRMFLSAAQIFQPGSTGGLYRSTDAGVTWTQSLTGQDARAIAIDPTNPDRIYVATWSGLQVSNDGGQTFTPNAAYAAITDQAVAGVFLDPLIPSTIYAAGFITGITPSLPKPNAGSVVLRSVDSGQSWEILRSASDKPYYTISHFLPGNSRFYPSVLANTGGHGVAEFIPATDVSAVLRHGAQGLGVTSGFEVEIENRGPYAATGVQWVTNLPSGVTDIQFTHSGSDCSLTGTTLTCAAGFLRANDKRVVAVSYIIPVLWDLSVDVEASGSVTFREHDLVTNNNAVRMDVDPVDYTLFDAPLDVSSTSIYAGDTVTFTTNVTYKGAGTDMGTAIAFNPGQDFVLKSMPSQCRTGGANLAYCELPPMTPGSSTGVLSFTATAPQTPRVSEAQIVLYRPSIPGGHPITRRNVAVGGGDLTITLTDSADPVVAGTSVTYRAVVTNTAHYPMEGAQIEAMWPAGAVTAMPAPNCSSTPGRVLCTLGRIEPTSTVEVTLTTTSAVAGLFTMSATISTTSPEQSANNTATQSTTYTSAPSASGRGGGGGAMDLSFLLLGLLLVIGRACAVGPAVARRH